MAIETRSTLLGLAVPTNLAITGGPRDRISRGRARNDRARAHTDAPRPGPLLFGPERGNRSDENARRSDSRRRRAARRHRERNRRSSRFLTSALHSRKPHVLRRDIPGGSCGRTMAMISSSGSPSSGQSYVDSALRLDRSGALTRQPRDRHHRDRSALGRLGRCTRLPLPPSATAAALAAESSAAASPSGGFARTRPRCRHAARMPRAAPQGGPRNSRGTS